MLASPQSMMELTRKGPIFEGVKQVHTVISDPTKTGIILTCLPEEMPVSETQHLYKKLGSQQNLVQVCVLNEVAPTVLPEQTDWAQARATLMESNHHGVREAVALTDRWQMRIGEQNRARTTLQTALDAPVVDLPFLFDRSLAFSELQALSQALEQQMGTV
jgi:anion-transporting  ArsA/GET3 family ATPase